MNRFCKMKGIKRDFSVARTLQQNGVAKMKNRTLIEAARTMLANSKLPTTFSAKAINTACYKTYLKLRETIWVSCYNLNTIDHLGKFDRKADEGFFVGYSTNSKAFRVFNNRTVIVEENLHVKFSENTPNIEGSEPNWLFDIDALTKSINYKPVVAGNQSNGSASTKACNNVGKTRVETVPNKDYILLPLWTQDPPFTSSSKDSPGAGFKPSREEEKKDAGDLGKEDSEVPSTEELRVNQENDANVNITNNITVSLTDTAAGIDDNVVDKNIVYGWADMNNLDTYFQVSLVPTTRIHKDHPLNQVIGDLQSATQTRQMTKNLEEYGFTLVELPDRKRAIGTKWVFRNKNDERGIVIKNKARLVTQGYTQEEGIDYDAVFARVARIEAIRIFLAYASFKDFVVYQMDVMSAFLYGKIENEVYVCQPPGFEDPYFPDRVYKVEKALYGLHQASKAWYENLSTYLLDNGFQRGMIDKTLFIRRNKSDILLVQVYVDDIIFWSTRKEMCTEFEKMMPKEFQMSSKGELIFFLGLEECLEWNGKAAKDEIGMDNHTRTYVIPSHTKKVFGNMRRVGKDFSSKITPLFPTMMVQAQEEIEDEAFNEENVFKHFNDPLHSTGDRIQLKELMEICTNLQQRVFDLETTKTSQDLEITSLKKKVKILEKKRKSITYGLKRLYKVRLNARVDSSGDEESLDEDIFGVNDQDDTLMFDANKDLQGEEVVVEKEVAGKDVSGVEEVNAASIATSVAATTTTITTPIISMNEITLAKALIEI
nr:hypothetical protein [Tanacetum cinerariifolium]